MKMKWIIVSCLALTLTGFAFSQQSDPNESESLLSVLASHKMIVYSFAQSGNLSVRILSEQQIRDIRLYYANKEVNARQYDVLMEKKRKLLEDSRSQSRPATNREQDSEPAEDPALTELNREIEKVKSPLSSGVACEVTHRGADFIGLKSLATSRGLLLPVHAIGMVVVESPEEVVEAPSVK